jgi:RNA polymerase sigma-70 factor (ECF subfamily)
VDKDNELLSRFRSGDIAAFEDLFKTYYQALVGYGRTILKDKDEAEDIVQQVFVTIWEKRSEMEVHTSFKGMMYRAVQNACLNRIKHQTVRRSHAKEVIMTGSSSFSQQDIQYKELQKKIDESIDQLPEQCARIFRMSRFDELKYQEIADKLGLSVKTVENQMGKALKLMRENMKDYLTVLMLLILKRYL